jgi:uncharacterized membrane protein
MAVARDMDQLPPVLPAVGAAKTDWRRAAPAAMALEWLRAGWRDLIRDPTPSLAYGLLVSVASFLVVGGLFRFGHDYILFPALSGVLVVAPNAAIGLY